MQEVQVPFHEDLDCRKSRYLSMETQMCRKFRYLIMEAQMCRKFRYLSMDI